MKEVIEFNVIFHHYLFFFKRETCTKIEYEVAELTTMSFFKYHRKLLFFS